jgi:hypothetical protein
MTDILLITFLIAFVFRVDRMMNEIIRFIRNAIEKRYGFDKFILVHENKTSRRKENPNYKKGWFPEFLRFLFNQNQ